MKTLDEINDNAERSTLDTEEEWRYVEAAFGANVTAGKFRIIADWVEPASSDELRTLMRQIVSDHNAAIHEGGPRAYLYSELQHALKSQALLVEALRGVSIMLNTELKSFESEPWAQRVRAALKANSGLTERE